jgi:hypothetical protein
MNSKQKGYIIILLLILAGIIYYQEPRIARLTTPAHIHCEGQNYTIVSRQNTAGVYEACLTPEGEMELWNYYRQTNPLDTSACVSACVQMWLIENEICTLNICGSGCGPDSISTFSTEAQCRAIMGELPLMPEEVNVTIEEEVNETIEEVPVAITWFIISGNKCEPTALSVEKPQPEAWESLQECTDILAERDPFRFTSEINPKVLETYEQLYQQEISLLGEEELEQIEQRAEADQGPIWQSSRFWIALILLIIISIIYGIWERGPQRGFFRKKKK